MDDGGDMDDTLLQDVDDGGGDDDDEGFATELEEVSLMMETQNALQQFSIGLWLPGITSLSIFSQIMWIF